MHPVVIGSFKSVTLIAAAIIGILSNVAPLVPTLCAQLKLDPGTTQVVGTIIAMVMAACRYVTTMSVSDKGSSVEILPPPTVEASPVPFVPSQPEPKK